MRSPAASTRGSRSAETGPVCGGRAVCARDRGRGLGEAGACTARLPMPASPVRDAIGRGGRAATRPGTRPRWPLRKLSAVLLRPRPTRPQARLVLNPSNGMCDSGKRTSRGGRELGRTSPRGCRAKCATHPRRPRPSPYAPGQQAGSTIRAAARAAGECRDECRASDRWVPGGTGHTRGPHHKSAGGLSSRAV